MSETKKTAGRSGGILDAQTTEVISVPANVITFKLPADEKAALERIASEEERTVSALLRLLVRERIAKKEAA